MEKTSSCEGSLLTEEDIKNLRDGLLSIYQEPLEKVSENLRELTDKQKALIDIVESQNQNLQSCQNSEAVKQLFSDIVHCRDRLISIKKQMVSIHERSNKLRTRSQNVLSRAKTRQTTRIQELEKEQRLIGGQQNTSNSPSLMN